LPIALGSIILDAGGIPTGRDVVWAFFGTFFLVMFVAYPAAVVLGIPAWLLFRRLGWRHPAGFAACGAAIGTAANSFAFFPRAGLEAPWLDFAVTAALAAVAGAISGGCFGGSRSGSRSSTADRTIGLPAIRRQRAWDRWRWRPEPCGER